MSNTAIDTAALMRWIREFARIIIVNKDELSELDSASGDADHGSNMERGMIAVLAILDSGDVPETPTEFLKTIGVTIVNKVGGSSGALYGTIFLRMARSAAGASALNGAGFAAALRAGLDGIVERGGAKAGDKTMYDALAPAVDALENALAEGRTFRASLQSALTAAEAGRDATIQMAARRGKSSYLGEKSIGNQDPGATSVTMMIAAASATLG